LAWEEKSISPRTAATAETNSARLSTKQTFPFKGIKKLKPVQESGARSPTHAQAHQQQVQKRDNVEVFPEYVGNYSVQFPRCELDGDLKEPLYLRLYRRRMRWGLIGGENLVVNGILEDWEDGPPPQQLQIPHQPLYVGGKDIQMRRELQEEVDLGIAQWCPNAKVKYLLRSFLIPKTGGEFRKILDCTPINEYIRDLKFKMEDQRTVAQVLQRNMWGVTVDITKAFHHIRVGEELRPYLCTRYHHHIAQYLSMPFGLKSAPRIFSRIMHHCISVARREWPLLTFIQYMDDILILALEEQQLREFAPQFIQFLKDLGWLINKKKSNLSPAQKFQYLGWEWSTVNMNVALTMEKNGMLKKLVRRWISYAEKNDVVPIRSLASMIGRLSQTRLQHRNASLYLSFLNTLKSKAVRAIGWEGRVRMNRSVLPDLLWWRQILQENIPASLLRPTAEMEMWTDASPSGWGAVVLHPQSKLFAQGKWNNTWSSNKRELVAIQMAMRYFSKLQQTRVVKHWLVHSDNKTTVYNINRRASANTLNFPMRNLFNELTRESKTLRAIYVKGVNNSEADSLSRLARSGDYTLKEGMLQRIQEGLGVTIDCDLFANRQNRQHPRYVSLSLKDRKAMARDAMSIPWTNLGIPLIHPPIPLIQRCLNKIREEGLMAVVIAPFWQGQWWSTALKALTTRLFIVGEASVVLKKGVLMMKHGDKLPPGQIAAHLVQGGTIAEMISYKRYMTCTASPIWLNTISLQSVKEPSETIEED
jgi:ribonuclease HI